MGSVRSGYILGWGLIVRLSLDCRLCFFFCASKLSMGRNEMWLIYCKFGSSRFMMAAGRATLLCGLFYVYWSGAGGVLSGSVLDGVWSFGQVLILRAGRFGCRYQVEMGRFEMGPGFC